MQGNEIWNRTFGYGYIDVGTSIAKTEDNNFIITGSTQGIDGDQDIWVMKVDTDGDSLWSMTLGGDYVDFGSCIKTTDDGNYILSGYLGLDDQYNFDMYLALITEDGTSVKEIIGKIPNKFLLHDPRPNPFNASVTLDFTLPQAGDITISVFDVTGKTVATLFDGPHSSGTGTVTWNAENIPSGVYFARLESGGAVQTRKLLLVK